MRVRSLYGNREVSCSAVNTEEAQGLAASYGIRTIATLVLFRNGTEVKRTSGPVDAGSLVRWAI